jgi:hypothetical protein
MFTRRFVLVAATLLFLSVTAVGDQNIPTAICNDNRTTAGTLAHSVLQIHLPTGVMQHTFLCRRSGRRGTGRKFPARYCVFRWAPKCLRRSAIL